MITSHKSIELPSSKISLLPVFEFPVTDLAHKLTKKNVEVPEIFLTLLGAGEITPSLVLSQNAKEKNGRNLVAFKK